MVMTLHKSRVELSFSVQLVLMYSDCFVLHALKATDTTTHLSSSYIHVPVFRPDLWPTGYKIKNDHTEKLKKPAI